MGTFSIFHWIIVLLFLGVIFIVPGWVIAKKTGRHGALSLLMLIPYVGSYIYMGILAFGRWPDGDKYGGAR
jgi:uncharacterized membrane protein YhaH (DUF805 family)